jgi:hypothetical protein
VNFHLEKYGDRDLRFLTKPLVMTAIGILVCENNAHASAMTVQAAELLVNEVGGFFTGTGFKVGLGVTTVSGMIYAAAKQSIAMAGMVMVIGLLASIWIGKLMSGS